MTTPNTTKGEEKGGPFLNRPVVLLRTETKEVVKNFHGFCVVSLPAFVTPPFYPSWISKDFLPCCFPVAIATSNGTILCNFSESKFHPLSPPFNVQVRLITSTSIISNGFSCFGLCTVLFSTFRAYFQKLDMILSPIYRPWSIPKLAFLLKTHG